MPASRLSVTDRSSQTTAVVWLLFAVVVIVPYVHWLRALALLIPCFAVIVRADWRRQ